MELTKVPFNITLMSNNRNVLRNLQPVTSTDVFEGASKKLNDQGLFSTTLFGRMGEERRANTFSYIDLRTDIMHPILYKNIEKVATFYTLICSGTAYAKWDEKTKTFIESDQVEGETGFGFFMKHFKDIQFERNDSERRNLRIDVLDKFRQSAVYDFILVIPAGIRDIEEDQKSGRMKQGEVNEFYRNLIGLSKNIDTTFKDNKFNDGTKLLMQRNFNAIYDLLFSYLEGKRGLTQEKFSKRKIENGTRSVLAVLDLAVEDMRGEGALGMESAIAGLFQTSKAILPLTQNAFKHELIMSAFSGDGYAEVLNTKTLALETRVVDSKTRNRYMTEDGINDWLNKFENASIRHKPVLISNGYLALVYKDEKGFKIIRDIRNVPESKLEKVSPMTYAELLYYLIKPKLDGHYGWVTRFPYTGIDSTTPNKVYLKTTEQGQELREYNYNWEIDETSTNYPEWPIVGGKFIETLQVHPSQLKGKGADFDGDTGSMEITYSDESKKELDEYFDNLDNYFVDGKIAGFGSTDTLEWVLRSMSK